MIMIRQNAVMVQLTMCYAENFQLLVWNLTFVHMCGSVVTSIITFPYGETPLSYIPGHLDSFELLIKSSKMSEYFLHFSPLSEIFKSTQALH